MAVTLEKIPAHDKRHFARQVLMSISSRLVACRYRIPVGTVAGGLDSPRVVRDRWSSLRGQTGAVCPGGADAPSWEVATTAGSGV